MTRVHARFSQLVQSHSSCSPPFQSVNAVSLVLVTFVSIRWYRITSTVHVRLSPLMSYHFFCSRPSQSVDAVSLLFTSVSVVDAVSFLLFTAVSVRWCRISLGVHVFLNHVCPSRYTDVGPCLSSHHLSCSRSSQLAVIISIRLFSTVALLLSRQTCSCLKSAHRAKSTVSDCRVCILELQWGRPCRYVCLRLYFDICCVGVAESWPRWWPFQSTLPFWPPLTTVASEQNQTTSNTFNELVNGRSNPV